MTIDIRVKQLLEDKNRRVENAVMRLGRFITQGKKVLPMLHRTGFDPIISDENGYVYFSRLFSLKNQIFLIDGPRIVEVIYSIGYWLDGRIDIEEGQISYPSKYHEGVEEYFRNHKDVIIPVSLGTSHGSGFHAGEIQFDTSNDDLPLRLNS